MRLSKKPAVVGGLPVFICCIIQISHGFEPSETFDRNLFLDTTSSNTVGQYRLYWKVVGDEIKFEAHVATLGWIGLGFSPTGGMTGADVMVGGVRNGKPYIYDRHATGTVMPVMDAKQDYQALYGAENATHTVLKFKRKLNTCDRDDWTISNDTVKLIWAYNPADAISENEFNLHERRGTTSIMLLDPTKPYVSTECGSSVTPSVDKTTSGSSKTNKGDPVFVGSASAQYSNHLVMDPNGNYHLFWRYDDTTITFEVQAKAQGWVGLGISPTGGMAGADIVHAFIDKTGSPQLTDRYAPATGMPEEDSHQDYKLVRGSKNGTHIIVVFSRKKFTCDDRDLPLTNDTMKLIWAMSDVVPVDKNNFQMHQPTSRGTKNVRLFEKQMVELPLPSDVKNLDVFVTNVSIPDDYHTLYWCQLFELPQWKKHHVIRFDPVIQKGNEMVVHHMILYECQTDMSSQYMAKAGEPCFDRTGTTRSPLMECTTNYVAGWAVGAGSVIYPSDIGLPMFGSGASKYMMMELHYDNSNYLKGKVDNSGFRIYLTPTLRLIESGGMMFGVPVGSEYMMLPAGQPEFTFYTYCYAECTNWIPPEGFTVMSGTPHTHLAGRKVRLHHIRNGVQLPDLFNDENYDFNYQASIVKSTPVKILPGDEFIVECVYNTSGRNETTYGGYSTRQEMCLMFGDIYPRPKAGGFLCMSYPYYGSQDFKKLFNGNYDGKEFYVLPNGTNITAKQFAETMVKFPNQSFIQQYQNIIKNGEQLVYCNKGQKNDSSEDDWGVVFRPGPVQITKPLAAEVHCLNETPDHSNVTGNIANTIAATSATTRAPVAITKRASSLKAYGAVVTVIFLIYIIFLSKDFCLYS